MKILSWACLLPDEKGFCLVLPLVATFEKKHMVERTAIFKREMPLPHEQKTVLVGLHTDFSRSDAIKHVLLKDRCKGRAITRDKGSDRTQILSLGLYGSCC